MVNSLVATQDGKNMRAKGCNWMSVPPLKNITMLRKYIYIIFLNIKLSYIMPL